MLCVHSVAAHSMVRALCKKTKESNHQSVVACDLSAFSDRLFVAIDAKYAGPLYSVTRQSDVTNKTIFPTKPGGFADSAAHDDFCKQAHKRI